MAWGQAINSNPYNYNNRGYGNNQNYPYQAQGGMWQNNRGYGAAGQSSAWQNSGWQNNAGRNNRGQYNMPQNNRGQSFMGQNPMGQNPMGQNPMGQNLMMQNLMGQNPMGQNPMNVNPQQTPGVSFEPIDEKTLQEIQAGFNKQDSKLENAPHIENNKILENIQSFAQNERNSSIFYKYLSTAAHSSNHRRLLERMSDESLANSNEYNMIYKSISGEENSVKETGIDNEVKFNQGIQWAIEVESEALRELSDIFEDVQSEKNQKKINSLLYKKVSNLSILHLLKT